MEHDLARLTSENEKLHLTIEQLTSQKSELMTKLNYDRNSFDTQKRLSEHWRLTISQEREKYQLDRTRYEQERSALMGEIEEERERNKQLEIQLATELAALQSEVSQKNGSLSTIFYEISNLGEGFASKIAEFTDLYHTHILAKSTGPLTPSKTALSRLVEPSEKQDIAIVQSIQNIKTQSAVLAEITYSAFRTLQQTIADNITKKEQSESTIR